jgi:O-antigen/teichoic acid export membrane protein
MSAPWKTAIAAHPLLATLYPLAKNSAVYLAGAGLVGLGGFVLVPMYTRCLQPADFGVYALIEITLLVAVTTAQLGLGTAYVRWHAESEASQRGVLLGTCSTLGLAASATGGALLVLLCASPAGNWFAPVLPVKWLLLPLVVFRSLQGLFFAVLQASQRAVAYVVAAVTRLVALTSAGILLVAVQHRAIRGVVESWLIGDAACFLVLSAFCLQRQRPGFDAKLMRPLLRYGFPLVWSSFMALLLDASGRFFLARYQSLMEVGVYAVGTKVANMLSMGFLQPFSSAWAGVAFQIAHRPNAALTYTKILGYAFVTAMVLIAVMILFGPNLLELFAGRTYIGAAHLLPWLLLPVALRLLEYWSSLPLYLKYKTQMISPLATVAAVLCAGLNFVLVPRFGALGASLAWTCALGVNIALTTAVSRRYYNLPFDQRAFLFASSLWLLAVLARRFITNLGPSLAIWSSAGVAGVLLVTSVWYFRQDIHAAKLQFTEQFVARADAD